MALSFQDKIQPINQKTPSFMDKAVSIKESKPEYATYSGTLGTKPNDSTFGKIVDNSITRGITKVFPGSKIGEAGGSAIAELVAGGKLRKAERSGLVPAGTTRETFKQPTVGQVVGDVAQIATTALPVTKVFKGAGGLAKFGNYATDVAMGYASDVGVNLANKEEKPFTPGFGTAISTGIPAVGGAVKILGGIRKSAQQNVDTLISKITQGKEAEVEQTKRALTQIDKNEIKAIKTYKDLKSVVNEKIAGISERLEGVLGQNNQIKKLDELNYKTKVGDIDTSHNYVDDAISQLEDFYTKTNDQPELLKIQQLKNKAQNEGLSILEIEKLAKQHGRDLSGFNANGQLASGLSRQAAENTRKGVKGTARQFFGDKIYTQVDQARSDLIKLRDSADDMVEEVNKLQRRIKERGLGERVGRLVFQATDALLGGTLKGFVQASFPRSQGIKIMNALEIEKALQKNLVKIKKLLEKDVSESQIINTLNEMLQKNQSPNELLRTNPIIQSSAITPSADISPSIQQGEKESMSLLESAKKNLKNKGQAGFMQTSTPKMTDELKDVVSKELDRYDDKILTVNGRPHLEESDSQFRLSQLKEILNKRVLTNKEATEAYQLLKLNQSGKVKLGILPKAALGTMAVAGILNARKKLKEK